MGDIFAATGLGDYDNDVLMFAPSGDLTTPSASVFGGHDGNLVTISGLGSIHGLVVSDNQLIVQDQSGRILFWNNPPLFKNGQPADGIVQEGTGSFTMQADQNHHLYVTLTKNPDTPPHVEIFQLPLVAGATPLKIIGQSFRVPPTLSVLGGGTITLSAGLWGLAPTPAGDFLWLSDTGNNRVLRIRNPLSDPLVDVILGQTNTGDTKCNRHGSSSSNAPADTLCDPGSLALDRLGNLYVSDHSLEIQGNMRLLEFNRSLFSANNPAVIYAPAASKIFPNIATWEPAFDSQNRMVVGYNPYWNSNLLANPHGGWFPGIYNNPLSATSTLPDAHLSDYYSMAFTATFDSLDNLYVGDLDRARVLIYEKPLP